MAPKKQQTEHDDTLEDVSKAHKQLEYWHLVGLGLTELKHIVGEVQTYPKIISM